MCQVVHFAISEDHKIKSEKLDKSLDLAKELKSLVKHEDDSLVWFNGISTIVGYLMPHPFLCI